MKLCTRTGFLEKNSQTPLRKSFLVLKIIRLIVKLFTETLATAEIIERRMKDKHNYDY
jgi:hypothetical protein